MSAVITRKRCHNWKLRILLHTAGYRPEAIGNGTFSAEICEWLAGRGHEVRVVCPPPYYPQWHVHRGYSAIRYKCEHIAGVNVFRCPIYIPAVPSLFRRLLFGLSYVISSFPVMVWMAGWRPDVVYVVEPNFLNSFNGLLTARLSGGHAWLQVQDFEFDIALGLAQGRGVRMAKLAFAFEAFVLRRFDVLSTISGRMLEHLRRKRVDPARCRLFRNWVDVDQVFPQHPSPMRRELGINENQIVCLFSGSMGGKHGIEIIIDAARMLALRPELQFLICGDGASLPELKKRAADLPQVRFVPLQPLAKLNDLLSVADIHLLPQKTSAQDLVMPSKLLGMTASGRPAIATVNPGTEVANALATFGIITPPDDAQALAGAIKFLADDPEERLRLGTAARHYAVENLSKQKILLGFESELMHLAGSGLTCKTTA
jgi:colanic acid biosynthesis glycosyl transferase WcaI